MTRGEYLLACRCRSSHCRLAASWLLERLDREGIPKTHAWRVQALRLHHVDSKAGAGCGSRSAM